MAINYFEDLGFGANLRQGLGDLAQVGYMKQAQAAQQAAEQKKEEQAMLKFANDQQKQRAAQSAGAFYNALQSNNPQLALQIAKQSEQDINSLGDPSFTVANVEQMLQTPEGMNQLKQMAAGTVQMAAGPDKFAEYVQAQQPKQAAPMSAIDAEKLKIEQAKLQLDQSKFDFDREQKKLERMQGYKETVQDDLKRQELQLKIDEQQRKIDENKAKADTAKNEKTAQLESARMNLDNMLNTIGRVEGTDIGVIEDATGPIDQMLPTLSQDTADFEELVGTLGSQAFLSQIPLIKGMGQLSNTEGEKLQAALQNFSLRQSPERLKENLAEARRLLNKARENIAKQYGADNTKPDTPAVNGGKPKFQIIEVR